MKTIVFPSAAEVFSYRQYKDETITALYDCMRRNPASRRSGSDESRRLAMAAEEIKRRGIEL